MKHFEAELPEGYRQVYEIDAKNSKTGVILNVVSLLLAVLVFLPFVFAIGFRELFGRAGTTVRVTRSASGSASATGRPASQSLYLIYL
jgi:hypothetical protein